MLIELLRNAPETPAPGPTTALTEPSPETSSETPAPGTDSPLPGSELTTEPEAPKAENGSELTAEGEGDEPEASELHGAPEGDYEAFTLPDGQVADDKLLGDFAPLFKELNLSQAGAQKLVEMKTKLDQRNVEVWHEHLGTLREQARKDPEIGGANYETNRRSAMLAVKTFGDESFRGMLDQYGVGSHPAMIKFCARVAKAMGEVPATTATNSSPADVPLYERMYKD